MEKTSSDVKSFTLADVATGIKQGVSIIPWGKENTHNLEKPSVLLISNENIIK